MITPNSNKNVLRLKFDADGKPLEPEFPRPERRYVTPGMAMEPDHNEWAAQRRLWKDYDYWLEQWQYKHGVKTETAEEWWAEFNRRLGRVKQLGTMVVRGYGCPQIPTAWMHWDGTQFTIESVLPRQFTHMERKTRTEVLSDVSRVAELLDMKPWEPGVQWHNDFGIRLS